MSPAGILASPPDVCNSLGYGAEAEKTHTDVTLPLLARMDELRQACWDAEAAKAELLQTCSDPVLLAQMEDIEEQLNLLQENHTNLQQAVADHRSQAESEQARAEQAKRIVHGEEQVKEHQRKAKWCERTANGCAAQLARVEKEIAKLERQQQAVREQMLVP